MSNQLLTTLQAGISVQRVMPGSGGGIGTYGTVVKDVTFQTKDLTDLGYVNQTLSKTTFVKCTLNRTNFTKSTLVFSEFENCSGSNTTFFQVTMSNAVFDGCTLSSSTWDGSWLQRIEFKNKTDFSGSTFSQTNLSSVTFYVDTILSRCDFNQSTLRNTIFAANIFATDLEFRRSTLDICTFQNARLTTVSFSDAQLTDVNFQSVRLENAEFDNAKVSLSSFRNATLNTVSFLHAKLSHVDADETTTFTKVSFVDTEMSYVKFQGVNLNGIDMAGAKLWDVDLSGSKLIATSLVAATLTDVNLYNAILSGTSSTPADESTVAATLSESKLNRLTVGGPKAYLRFTVFSHATMALSTFRGTDSQNMLNMSEADFTSAVVEDTTFELCNLSNSKFAQSKLMRVHFVDCAMSNMDVNGVQLQNCTADAESVLPRTWLRDANGWIYVYDDGPLPPEEANREIQDIAVYTPLDSTPSYYRLVSTLNQEVPNEVNSYYVTWLDDGTSSIGSDVRRINTKVQPDTFGVGSAVFVKSGEGKYVRAKITANNENGSYDVKENLGLAKTTLTNRTNLPLKDIFLEYFDLGLQPGTLQNVQLLLVGKINNQPYYRSIKQKNAEGLTEDDEMVTWFDGKTTTLPRINILSLNLVQSAYPFTRNGQVFVLIQTDVSARNDNHYVQATIQSDNGDGTSTVAFLNPNTNNYPETQNNENIYIQLPVDIAEHSVT